MSITFFNINWLDTFRTDYVFVTVHSLFLAICMSVCRTFGSSGSIVIDVKLKDQKIWHDRHIVIFVLQKFNFN
jgi:hypothetical protein